MKKKDEVKNKVVDMVTGTIPPSTQTRSDACYIEKQRTTQIIAAKSLLEEELAKSRPSLVSVATFRAAAYGDDRSGKAEGVEEPLLTENPITDANIIPNNTRSISAGIRYPDCEVRRGAEAPMAETSEGLVVVTHNAAMSVGDSKEGGSKSDGFSCTDSNSSRGESIHSQNNRKRQADESPKREWDETRRQKFPGTVTRTEGGCRVHIPSSIRAGGLEVIARLITPAASTTDTTDAAGMMSAPAAANTTGVMPTKDTTDVAGAPCASTNTGVTYNEESISRVNATSMLDVVGDTVHMASIVYQEVVILLEPLSTITDDALINLVKPILPEQLDVERHVTPESGLVDSLPIYKPTMRIPSASASQPTIVHGSISSGSINTVTGAVTGVTVSLGIPMAAEGWARDAQVVEGIFRIMEEMEPPWVTIEVFEAATVRFPTVDRKTLQRTIMTVMMTQRRCVVITSRRRSDPWRSCFCFTV